MTGAQAIGYAMNQTTAITAYTSTRIWNGLRPANSAVPSINYFKLSGTTRGGLTSENYTVNCRASDPVTADKLAKQVDLLWGGIEGMSTYGYWNGFDVVRASTQQSQGLIPEPEDGIYNAVVDINICYRVETVS